MILYILDTDHLSLLRFGHAEVTSRLRATREEQRAITIISVEEQLRGWFTQVRRARDAEHLARAYEGLSQVVAMANSVQVLPFTLPAVERYLRLRRTLPRVGKLDLAIAAIVLEAGGTIVTRNRQDFEQVPGLTIEDLDKATAELMDLGLSLFATRPPLFSTCCRAAQLPLDQNACISRHGQASLLPPGFGM